MPALPTRGNTRSDALINRGARTSGRFQRAPRAPKHRPDVSDLHGPDSPRVRSSPRSLKPHTSAYVSLTECTSIESGHLLPQRPVSEYGHHVTCVQSLFLSENHLLHFTNFFTLAQMCQPPSVSPCARVLAYFHKCFQGC